MSPPRHYCLRLEVLRFFSWARGPLGGSKATIPTVRFDPKNVTEAVRADLWDRINEFEDLPDGEQKPIFDAAIIMAERGGDLHHLTKTLVAMGLPKQRAGYISHYLGKRSTALMRVARMLNTGITEGKWLYSGAHCYSTNTPSPDEVAMDDAHRGANGTRFQLNQGKQPERRVDLSRPAARLQVRHQPRRSGVRGRLSGRPGDWRWRVRDGPKKRPSETA